MKSIKVKKILAAVLAASMVMASAVTVSASGSDTSDPGVSSSESSSSSSEETPSEASPSVTTYAETMSKKADAPVRVAGMSVRTSVGGVYAANKVQGVAVTTPAASLSASLGL